MSLQLLKTVRFGQGLVCKSMVRFIIYGVIFGAIYVGFQRIIKDWRGKFRDHDKKVHERDLKERDRPDVIDLEKDKDGVFRPGDKDGD